MITAASPVRQAVHQCTEHTLLRRFLQAYWLRPENALWMTLRSLTLSKVDFNQSSADVCCGDGIFMFLHFGGVLDPDFDVFHSVRKIETSSDRREDMFDYISDDYAPEIVEPPSTMIDVGLDGKGTLLERASRLGLYSSLVHCDANEPLPLPDEQLASVYCNSAYWVKDINGFLTELGRVTQPGGRIILQVKLDSLRHYNLEAHKDVLGKRFLKIIAAGRLASWPTLADQSIWERRFKKAGLSIEDATPFITRMHAHLWDIGLRPIAPLLVRMTSALSPETRSSIKRDWVDLMLELTQPLCDPTIDLLGDSNEPGEIQYTLQRG